MPTFFKYDPDEDLFQFDYVCSWSSLADVFRKRLDCSEIELIRSAITTEPAAASALGDYWRLPMSSRRQIAFIMPVALIITGRQELTPEEMQRFKRQFG